MPRRQITYSSHPTHRARMVHAQGERQFRTYDTSHIRPKKSKAPMVIALVLVAVVVIVAAFAIFNIAKGCSKSGLEGTEQIVASDVQVTVPEGASASDVRMRLHLPASRYPRMRFSTARKNLVPIRSSRRECIVFPRA